MSHLDGVIHLAKTREEMRKGLILATQQRDIDALMDQNPEDYAAHPMELLWPHLQHTERFSDPTGAVDTELRRSMVATHRVGNPAGSNARLYLMTPDDINYFLEGSDGNEWEIGYHGTSTPASLHLIANSKRGAQAFQVTDDPEQAILGEMQENYAVTENDVMYHPDEDLRTLSLIHI